MQEILDITDAKDLLLKGDEANVLAVEVHNSSLESSDFLFDAQLFWGVEGLGNDESLSRIPDGDRNGIAVRISKEYVTPMAPNHSPPLFIRGDVDMNGAMEVTDVIKTLNFQFVGEGIIDFETIFKAGRADSVVGYFIEDEREDNPFKNIKADYEYMSKQAFAS